MLISFQNTRRHTQNNVWPSSWAPHGPARLTRKINHHTHPAHFYIYIYFFLIVIFLFIYLFLFLFLAVLGLRFCGRAFSSCGERGPLFITVRGPLLLRSTGSRPTGSVIVAHGLSCSAACGILPDQGSNPCPPHWQADPQPLCHQGSPHNWAFFNDSILSSL